VIFELTWHGPVCDVTYSVEGIGVQQGRARTAARIEHLPFF